MKGERRKFQCHDVEGHTESHTAIPATGWRFTKKFIYIKRLRPSSFAPHVADVTKRRKK